MREEPLRQHQLRVCDPRAVRRQDQHHRRRLHSKQKRRCGDDRTRAGTRAARASGTSKEGGCPKRQEPVRTSAPAAPAVVAPVAAPAPIPAAAAAPVLPAQQQPHDFAGARQLILGGQYDAGIAAMRALKFDDHPDIATFLGLAYRKLGRLDEARAWYERALAVDPNHRLALSFYGMMSAETGDINLARADLEKLKLSCGGTECNEYQALAAVISSQSR